ncbi:amino acid ABC transporter substrate-binding protein [Clostridium cylindrosporum]|uniref:Cystine-binding periplasmic protein FliY n=1 Tax=Clostridium cylindrosporum DSM 605 TaxID=1121307 RepID=A0A0J8D9Y6_CLOCY|nr:amino acid ABC transporter substrate-binding protein [Clostridium cylindrosporum]KMT21124.1 cystine-binding periplasmic protein FliY [Clostridium cylindrosporum DSM 605]
MKKIFSLVVIAILSLSMLLTGCGKKAEQTTEDNSLKEIKDKGKLVIGLDDGFPPMGFRGENGQIVGFDIDLAKEVGKKLGVEVEFKPIDWNAKEMELKTKKIDAIWNGMSVTPEREKNMALSKPYLNNTQAFVVKKDSTIKSIADMKGKKIGFQDKSSSQEAFTADKNLSSSVASNQVYPKNKDVLVDLKVGRIDVALMDKVVSKYYLAKEKDQYVFLNENLGEEAYAVGFRKGDVKLRDEVNKILDELKKNGTTSNISKTWFGEDIVVK